MEQRTFIRRLTIVAGFVIGILLLLVFFAKALEAVLLVFGGVLLAVFLAAFTDWVAKVSRMPRGVALAAVLVLLLGLAGLGAWLLPKAIAKEAGDLTENLQQTSDQVRQRIEGIPLGRRILEESAGVSTFMPGAASRLGGMFSTVLGALSGVFVVLFVGLFLAAQPQLYITGTLRLFPLPLRRRIHELMLELGHVLRWWLLGQLVSMVVLGTQITIGLWLLGVPLAVPLGLLTAVFTFVPYLGPILATVPAVLVGLSVSGTKAIYVLLLCVAVQNIEGYIITPAIHQRAVSLPAGLTIAFQVFMAIIAGALGIILATPLMAVLFVLVRRLYIEDALGDSLDRPVEPFSGQMPKES